MVCEIITRKRAWMAVDNTCSLTTNKRTELSEIAGDDIIVVDIKMRGEKMIRIINIYDHRARETGERPARELIWQKMIRKWGRRHSAHGRF